MTTFMSAASPTAFGADLCARGTSYPLTFLASVPLMMRCLTRAIIFAAARQGSQPPLAFVPVRVITEVFSRLRFQSRPRALDIYLQTHDQGCIFKDPFVTAAAED